jgi:hypothetical protein
MRVRIYQPSKTAMQSGRGGTKRWMLEFEPGARREMDPLMGWTSSRDTRAQIRMSFETLKKRSLMREAGPCLQRAINGGADGAAEELLGQFPLRSHRPLDALDETTP